jgi:hypothetical protein
MRTLCPTNPAALRAGRVNSCSMRRQDRLPWWPTSIVARARRADGATPAHGVAVPRVGDGPRGSPPHRQLAGAVEVGALGSRPALGQEAARPPAADGAPARPRCAPAGLIGSGLTSADDPLEGT